MLSCREVTENASALVDGDLSFRDRMAVRMHIAMCGHCRRFVRHLRLLVAALGRREKADQLSDDFMNRMMAAFESPGTGSSHPKYHDT